MTNIQTIRPREIFKLIEKKFPNENVEVRLGMPPSGIGSLLTLESAIIAAFLKLTDPKAVFEFGTYHGSTTVFLAMNTGPETNITSIDLPIDSDQSLESKTFDLLDEKENDEFLRRQRRSSGASKVALAAPDVRSRIRLIHENSMDFSPDAHRLVNSQEFILIDGGHDYETITNDTDKAFEMGREDMVLFWHDYNSTIHKSVSRYLKEIANSRRIIHVGSTMLAFHLSGKYQDLI
jgi:hypothetical protein